MNYDGMPEEKGEWSEQALRILNERYLLKEGDRVIETPEQMCWRTACAIAEAERGYGATDEEIDAVAREFYIMMVRREFLPNSPCLMNCGLNNGLSLAACFLVEVPDSMEGIFDAVKATALVSKSGGGVGLPLGSLRSSKARVKTTGGTSSGPVSFLRVFDSTFGVVSQAGRRRGAGIAVLPVDHPDILDFINCKRDGGITNLNISVGINDAFMDALKNNGTYDLIEPSMGVVVDTISAKTVWDELVESAWACGDPGLLFIDSVNKSRANPVPKLGPISGCNPCFNGSTLVAVADGRVAVRIDELAQDGSNVPVYCYHDGLVQIKTARNPRKTREQVETWKVTLDDGSHIVATPDHNFLMRDGSRKQLRELQPMDSLMPFTKTGKDYYTINLNNGDIAFEHRMIAGFYRGCELKPYPEEITHHENENGLDNRYENLSVGSPTWHNSSHQLGDNNVMRDKWWNKLPDDVKSTYKAHMSASLSGSGNGMWGKHHSDATKMDIAQKIANRMTTDARTKQGAAMKAWYRANGTDSLRGERVERVERICANEHCQVNFKALPSDTRRFCSQHCALVWVSTLPKHYSEDTRKRIAFKSSEFANTERGRQAKRDAAYASAKSNALRCARIVLDEYGTINIKDWDDYRSLIKRANPNARFITRSKIIELFPDEDKFKELASEYNHKIVSIEFNGYEDVYNLTVDDAHTVAIITKDETIDGKRKLTGIVTPQCGEAPLYSWESCVLGSINLSQFVTDRIDWDRLQKATLLGVRFLDNTIDVSTYALPEITEAVKANRRIGLGIMGWADMLIKLGIPFDSPEALRLAEQVMSFITDNAQAASHALADVRGSFPNWQDSIYKTRPIRNSARTIIAPTGTVSLIAGCSSGLEPLFAIAFSHNNQLGREMRFINPLFIGVAKQRGFYSEELMERVAQQGTLHGIDGIPDDIQKLFVTAHEISPEHHVRMQAAFQKHLDNAASKTINAPSSATVEDISRIYHLAYDLGCLGTTVFRDGCKGAQVLSVGTKSELPSAKYAPVEQVKSRPAVLDGTTYKTETPLGTAYVTVNSLDGEPLEVFCTVGKAGTDVSAVSEAMGRIISLILRIPSSLSPTERLRKAGSQLLNIGGGRSLGFGANRVKSLPDAIGQVIGQHVDGIIPEEVHDTEDMKVGDLCPECGNATFVQEEGCCKCLSCGHSEC